MRYRIVHENTNIELPQGRFLLGRSPECHLVLDDPSVSRQHAALVMEADDLFLEDLGSRNGCLLNGKRAEKRTRLKDGDRIVIGHQTVRIIALERISGADRTMALGTCKVCGAWMAAEETVCGRCGKPRGDEKMSDEPPAGGRSGRRADSVIEQQPVAMMAGLATKAVSMGKLDEAGRLVENLFAILTKRVSDGETIPEKDLESAIGALLAVAEAAKAPEHIGRLFGLFASQGALMPRETVDRLYDIVRVAGYRRCREMDRYLEVLAARSTGFSPAERFIHKRLEGLVRICG